jgi:hypothetical protein
MGFGLPSVIQCSGGRHVDLTQVVRGVELPIAHGVETIAHAKLRRDVRFWGDGQDNRMAGVGAKPPAWFASARALD